MAYNCLLLFSAVYSYYKTKKYIMYFAGQYQSKALHSFFLPKISYIANMHIIMYLHIIMYPTNALQTTK